MSRLLAEHAEFLAAASYQGKLYNIEDYPGAVPSEDMNDSVPGEVYLLHRADITLALLDRYEEVGPEFAEPNEYNRLKQAVLLENGRGLTAWVYVYNHPTKDLVRIQS